MALLLIGCVSVAPGQVSQVRVLLGGSPPLPDPELPGIQFVTLSDSSIVELRERVLAWYLYEGYPFASIGTYLSSPDTLVLRVVPGRHALLEEIRFEPEPATRDWILLRFLDTGIGEAYSPSEIENWKSRLERLEFIDWVGETHLALGQNGNLVLIQELSESPMGYFAASMGFSGTGGSGSTEGGGEVAITNLLGTGRQFELSVWSSEWGIDASVRYREPWILRSPFSAELRASQEIPDSTAVNREIEVVIILGLESLETWAGAGLWKGYQPDSIDRSYSYAIAGMGLLAGRRVHQGWQGIEASLESRIGRASGPDSGYVLASADLDFRGDLFRGVFGAGLGLLSGGIFEGEWIEGRLKAIGGMETLRGYPENSFRAGRYLVARPELSIGETSTRVYVFADIAVLELRDGMRYPVGMGAGIRGTAGVLEMDAGVGFPVLEGLGRARFYLRALASII